MWLHVGIHGEVVGLGAWASVLAAATVDSRARLLLRIDVALIVSLASLLSVIPLSERQAVILKALILGSLLLHPPGLERILLNFTI